LQWLPDKVVQPDQDFSVQRLILGTHTSEDENNYLMLAEVRLRTFPLFLTYLFLLELFTSSNSSGKSEFD
jgi:hypothetical protein